MRLILLILSTCLHFIVLGQDNISGVVNRYYKVTNISNTEVITLNSVDGLNAFDKVIIIQMKGASVRTNVTDDTYGSITSLNNAGNYEVATICKVNESSKTVTLVHKLLNTNGYDVSAKVQMVRIARYEEAIVTDFLKAAPWSNTADTGGVLAVMAGKLTLDAPISVDGMGYKGGIYDLTSGEYCRDNFADQFNYDPNPIRYNGYNDIQLGAYKGESITDVSITHQGGKGALATGGGGGNNHNTAGGGGGNIGAGGMGGNNTSEQVNWWQPACYSNHPGVGGYALTYDPKRLFMGGGGGAGHGNNTPETGGGGGNGGGIVFIIANSLTSNGKSISANGRDGLETFGDGASGGGGGGSIVLNVGTFLDAPVISANGGNGGAIDNENIARRCIGEGGGGGGGAVYFSGSPQGAPSIEGGAKGIRKLSDLYCTRANMARDGNNGGVYSPYTMRQSEVINVCPEWSSLPVNLLLFKVSHKGAYTNSEWKVGNPEDAFEYILQRRSANSNWQNIYTKQGNRNSSEFQKGDGPLAAGIYFYRLKIIEKSRAIVYSPVQQASIKSEDLNRLVIYPNPAKQLVNISKPSTVAEELHIYDMSSKLVYKRKITGTDPTIKQDISFLAEGVYMIQVGKYTARFVVFK